MGFRDMLETAISAIWSNKMRSILTVLGIVIGIASIIAVISMGQSSQAALDLEFEKYGVNRGSIMHNWATKQNPRDYLTVEDVDALKEVFADDITAISPLQSQSVTVAANRKQYDAILYGSNEEFADIQKINMLFGRYLIGKDVETRRLVGVISDELAIALFNKDNAVGKQIQLDIGAKKMYMSIVGVLEAENEYSFSQVYVPITALQKLFGTRTGLSLHVSCASDVDPNTTLDLMVGFLSRRHNNVGQNKYRAHSIQQFKSMQDESLDTIKKLTTTIAAISLLVGGIGVMNIMLVSVTERTKEIGIRKALGARYEDILLQFLGEAVILTFSGGLIGTILGIVVAQQSAVKMENPFVLTPWAIVLAWVFSVGIGLLFGVYPANKAAKMHPIEALRYE